MILLAIVGFVSLVAMTTGWPRSSSNRSNAEIGGSDCSPMLCMLCPRRWPRNPENEAGASQSYHRSCHKGLRLREMRLCWTIRLKQVRKQDCRERPGIWMGSMWEVNLRLCSEWWLPRLGNNRWLVSPAALLQFQKVLRSLAQRGEHFCNRPPAIILEVAFKIDSQRRPFRACAG